MDPIRVGNRIKCWAEKKILFATNARRNEKHFNLDSVIRSDQMQAACSASGLFFYSVCFFVCQPKDSILTSIGKWVMVVLHRNFSYTAQKSSWHADRVLLFSVCRIFWIQIICMLSAPKSITSISQKQQFCIGCQQHRWALLILWLIGNQHKWDINCAHKSIGNFVIIIVTSGATKESCGFSKFSTYLCFEWK